MHANSCKRNLLLPRTIRIIACMASTQNWKWATIIINIFWICCFSTPRCLLILWFLRNSNRNKVETEAEKCWGHEIWFIYLNDFAKCRVTSHLLLYYYSPQDLSLHYYHHCMLHCESKIIIHLHRHMYISNAAVALKRKIFCWS